MSEKIFFTAIFSLKILRVTKIWNKLQLTYCYCTKNLRKYTFVSLFKGLFVVEYKRLNCPLSPFVMICEIKRKSVMCLREVPGIKIHNCICKLHHNVLHFKYSSYFTYFLILKNRTILVFHFFYIHILFLIF